MELICSKCKETIDVSDDAITTTWFKEWLDQTQGLEPCCKDTIRRCFK